MCGCFKEIGIPNVEKTHERHHILLKRSVFEVIVYKVEAMQKLFEALGAIRQGNCQTNRRVNGIAAAYPIPKTKRIVRINSEVFHFIQSGRYGHKVLTNCFGLLLVGTINGTRLLQRLKKPCASTASICQRFKRRKGLRNHNKECRLRIKAACFLNQIRRVNIRHKARGNVSIGVWAKRFIDHHRAQIRAANTNTDDGFYRFSRNAFPLARAYPVTKGIHPLKRMTHIGYGILAIYDKCTNLVSGTSQRRMQNRTILCCIDVLSAIHIGTALFKTHLTGKLTQQLKGLLVNKIL